MAVLSAESMNTLARALLAACLLWAFAATAGTPDAVTSDGGRYYGQLVSGKLHGKGRLEWENGGQYEGDFANGLMSGKGRFHYPNGGIYEGDFRDGMLSGRGRFEFPGREVYQGEFKLDMYWGQGEVRYADGRVYRGAFERGDSHGAGRLDMPNGDVFEGEFQKGDLVKGNLKRQDGARYEGGFKNWLFDGAGRFTNAAGDVWEGSFTEGNMQGQGKSSSQGGTYEGEFKDWAFNGQGELRFANGDIYRGGFANGMYEGQGTLTYARPRPDGRKVESGVWQFGRLAGVDDLDKTRRNVEVALYAQKGLLSKALVSLKPRQAGKINLYLLAIAGDGSQEVFRREVEFVRNEFAQRFHTAGRAVTLINSRSTAGKVPMATRTSIRESLAAIAKRMDREQDILFLFLTSHGSAQHELSLAQNGMELSGLPAAQLATMLKETGIRWKVVVVSACYGGGFIDPLKDERTMVIAAARHDRRSFGCADENDFTYFGRAFFKEALPRSSSFQDAFLKAEALVGEWERKDTGGQPQPAGSTAAAADEQSLPQMHAGKAIEDHLRRWWAQPSR